MSFKSCGTIFFSSTFSISKVLFCCNNKLQINCTVVFIVTNYFWLNSICPRLTATWKFSTYADSNFSLVTTDRPVFYIFFMALIFSNGSALAMMKFPQQSGAASAVMLSVQAIAFMIATTLTGWVYEGNFLGTALLMTAIGLCALGSGLWVRRWA